MGAGSTGGSQFRGGFGFTSQNAQDIFKNFFGGWDPFADFFDDDDFFPPGFSSFGGMGG